MGLFNMLFGTGDLPSEIGETEGVFQTKADQISPSQATSASGNNTIDDIAREKSQVFETAKDFVKKNMKLIGGAAAALFAYRAMTSGSEMTPPAPPGPVYGNAALPQEPMVSAPTEYSPQLTAPRAHVMPSNNYSMHAVGGGTMNSGNVDRTASNIALAMEGIQGGHSTINIQESIRS